MQSAPPTDHGSRPAPRRRAAQVLLLLALAQPTLAWPYSLDQLLRLPLEQLLQVEFTPWRGPR
jgi:hypothetical protein